MNGKFWQVCELKENVRSFIELSVSAVPEIWIVQLEDGSYICYWPKENVGKKIRSFASPKDGGRWTNYKCRILMKGEKFPSYEEARQAEIDAQDVSTSLDTTKVLNSTMDFDVSNTDIEETDDESSDCHEDLKGQKCGKNSDERNASTFACDSTMDFDVSDAIEENDDEMVGNDSTEFNKEVLFGGYYCSNKIVVDSAVHYDSSSGSYYNASNSSVESGYSYHFGSDNDFLTSTAIADTNILNNADVETILSSIKALEVNITAFYQDIKKDLQEIRERCSRKSEIIVNNDEDITKENSKQIWDQSVISVSDDPGDNSPSHMNKNEDEAESNSLPILMDNPVSDEIIYVVDLSQENSPTVHEQLNAKLINYKMDLNENNEHQPIAPVAPNAETFDTNLPKQIKMKIFQDVEYFQNEDLLELDEEMERKLVNDLLPLNGESEAAYIKRTVDMLFDDNFFLKFITWKPEKGRVCIKHTNTLKCWKESFGKRFGSDEKNERYMAHFRRMKSAMRASQNSAAKRAATSSGTKGMTLTSGVKRMKLTSAQKKQA